MNKSKERRAILFSDPVSTQKYFLTRRPNSLFLPAFQIKTRKIRFVQSISDQRMALGCSRTNKNTDDLMDIELENMFKKKYVKNMFKVRQANLHVRNSPPARTRDH